MNVQVDCKALAFSGRPDQDGLAARVFLTLTKAEVVKLACQLVEHMDVDELETVSDLIVDCLRRLNW